MPRWIAGVGALLIVTTFLSGCGSDPGFSDEQFIPADGTAQFVNMMPDSPQVRMFHGIYTEDVSFPFASPVDIRPVDRYDWEIAYVNAAGDRINIAEAENQQISEDTLSTFLYMGTTTQPNIQIVDTPTVPQADRIEGTADVWFASNSTAFDMLDIYMLDADTDIATEAPLTTVTSGTFSQLISVPSGTSRRLTVTVAGTSQVVFDSGAIEIVDRRQELFAIVDDFGPGASNHVDVIRTLAASRSIIRDVSQGVETRAGNYSNFADLNLTVGGTSFTNIAQDSISAYQVTTNGTQSIVTEVGGNVTEETELVFLRGSYHSVISFNDSENAGQTRSVTVLDATRPTRDRSGFKFVNGSNQTVDLYGLRDGQDTDDVPPLLSDVGFGGTNTTETFSENVRFLVTTPDQSENLGELTQTLIAGENYTLIFDSQGDLHLLSD